MVGPGRGGSGGVGGNRDRAVGARKSYGVPGVKVGALGAGAVVQRAGRLRGTLTHLPVFQVSLSGLSLSRVVWFGLLLSPCFMGSGVRREGCGGLFPAFLHSSA